MTKNTTVIIFIRWVAEKHHQIHHNPCNGNYVETDIRLLLSETTISAQDYNSF